MKNLISGKNTFCLCDFFLVGAIHGKTGQWIVKELVFNVILRNLENNLAH